MLVVCCWLICVDCLFLVVDSRLLSVVCCLWLIVVGFTVYARNMDSWSRFVAVVCCVMRLLVVVACCYLSEIGICLLLVVVCCVMSVVVLVLLIVDVVCGCSRWL